MKETTIKAVAIIFEQWPSPPATPRIIDQYEQLLDDLESELLEKSVIAACKTLKFRPAVSEILDLAHAISRGARRTGAEAWGDVVSAIRHCGSYSTPSFEDELTAYAVERCGWRNLCLEGSSDAADRARFIEIYEAASERRIRNEKAGLELPARGDSQSLQRGRHLVSGPSAPKLLGAR